MTGRRLIAWRRLVSGIAALGLTAGALAALAPRVLEQAADVAVVARDDPRVRADREIAAEFGFERPVVWVIEAKRGTIWSPPMLARLAALTRAVFAIPGVIADDIVGLASPNLRDLRVTEESLEPEYLMGAVPETADAVRALRARVEGDPKYAGTLVSRDGRAAMVVANFMADADPAAVGAAARALADRHRDAETAVYTTTWTLPARAGIVLAVPLGVIAAGGLLALGFLAGLRRAVCVLFAVMLAAGWLVVALGAAGALEIPWAVFALAPTAFLAAAFSIDTMPPRRAIVVPASALAAGFASLAWVAGAPAGAFGLAAAIGVPLAAVAAFFARGTVRPAPPPPSPHHVPALAWLLLAGSLVGIGAVGSSWSVAGYGLRYLPGWAGADLRALAARFPPPVTVAIRLRGAPGFVQEPAVLDALDAAVAAARADPAVESAMSLADLVKLVHRAFNDDDPRYERIPRDRAAIARYLALSYSPGFRRFVDRAFERTAIWAYLASERPADVARVVARMQAALARHPLPGIVVDPPGGDGAVLLVMAETAGRLAAGGTLAVAVVVLGLGLGLGRRAAAHGAVAAVAAVATAGGLLGWLALPIDLLTLPAALGAVAVATAVAGAAAHGMRGGEHLALALVCAGLLGIVAPFDVVRVVGVMSVAPAVALAVAPRRRVAIDENRSSIDAAPALARAPHRGAA